jgi:hypothetical protein
MTIKLVICRKKDPEEWEEWVFLDQLATSKHLVKIGRSNNLFIQYLMHVKKPGFFKCYFFTNVFGGHYSRVGSTYSPPKCM